MFRATRSLEDRLMEASMSDANSRLMWPLFPTRRDLLPGRRTVNVPIIKEKGAYTSSKEYLKTHVDLLTEDFMRTLNEQVNEYRDSLTMPGRLFKIRFGETERELSHERARVRRALPWLDGIQVEFVEKVQWEDDDRRFMSGSLLLFSSDNFKTMMFGIVKYLYPQQQQLMVRMISCRDRYDDFLTDCSEDDDNSFLMMESQVFYYPYLHATSVLREMTKVPFEQEIVYAIPSEELPSYLNEIDINLFLESKSWNLSSSQSLALQSVFNHRVALVQGPPGTGKTFVGCKIVELLILLRRMGYLRAPILVITTTQHTVDEFLKRCLVFTKKAIHAHGLPYAVEEDKDRKLQQCYNSTFRMDEKLDVMRVADVLAMTTSRAAYIYEHYLKRLSISVVVVEEAAEGLEGAIMASVPSSTKHLILLGDHKQLCPSTANHELGIKHNLSLSVMERLTNNGFECPMLTEQRRMRPEIASLIAHIYPGLTNHPETEGRPHIGGMRKDVFFFTHNEEESQDRYSTSFYNTHEAVMVVNLCQYLLIRGHSAEDITILTTYRKQLKEINKFAEETPASKVRATVVDNFQGEESKIVLLSLVRSNSQGSIGFLKKENRVCVALSRARDGLYIFGNLSCLVASSAQVWSKVMNVLSEQDVFGKNLPLICPHGRSYDAKTAEDLHEAMTGCVICQLELAWKQAVDDFDDAEKKLAVMEEKLENILLKGKGENESVEKYRERVEKAVTDEQRYTTLFMRATDEKQKSKLRLQQAKDLLALNRISLITDTKYTVEMLLFANQAHDLSIT